MFYVFDLLQNRCNCISMKNRRKRGKKEAFSGKKEFCEKINSQTGVLISHQQRHRVKEERAKVDT